MRKFSGFRFSLPLILPIATLTLGMSALSVRADSPLYNPIRLPASNEVDGTLTNKDIPTGQGGFSRDYLIPLQQGDQIVIDLSSKDFDSILTLIAPDGTTAGENDDGPDGSTNSLLFARVTKPGNYIIRVSPYGGQGTGAFKLKVTRLRPA
jgi:hypothetical protein